MSRYIDADEAKENVCKWECGGESDCPLNKPDVCTHEKCNSMRAIDETPTVDATPVVHAHWVEERVDHSEWEMLDHVARCSNCGCVPDDHYTFAYVNMMWKYCPECGSKMDEIFV